MPLKIILRYLVPLLLASAGAAAWGQTIQLTLNVPECRVPAGKVLPDKYYKLKSAGKAFKWVTKATAKDRLVSGGGWERVDGSDMRDWFSFYRIDLNGDGICDWYLNVSAPTSTGGDHDSINTLYLGGPAGWSRIGAAVPGNKPDALGFGETYAQQAQFLFGEEPSLIHDAAGNTNYLITAFYSRNERRDSKPGYRIYAWDAGKRTLRLLDKRKQGSKAAEVYAFFKAHGARTLANRPAGERDSITDFDPEVEAFELATAQEHALQATDLSLLPQQVCEAPAKAPPASVLNKIYPGFSTTTNPPFRHDVDITGDGWCDWVSSAAQPPHRNGVALDQPLMKDFIFVGSMSGWRRFGNQKAMRAFVDQHDADQPGPYRGDAEVSAFVSPLFIYAKGELRPYVAAISIGQDVLDARAEDVVVYRWNDEFDALLQVGEQERTTVLQFLQMHYCGNKVNLPVQSVAEAVCAR
jgi:hypothetical protein